MAALALEHRAALAALRGDEGARPALLREARRLYEAMGADGHARRLDGEGAGADSRE